MNDMTDEQVELNQRVENYLQASLAANGDWMEIYSDGLDYVYGNQLANRPAELDKKGWQRIQANYIFPAVMQELSLLAQRRPEIKTDPIEPSDSDGSDIWGKVLQWIFDKGIDVPSHLNDAAMDGASYGHWVGYVYWEDRDHWDAEKQGWDGAIKLRLLRPEIFGMDTEAEKPADAQYMYHYRSIPLAKAISQWPDHVDAIKRAATHLQSDADPDMSMSGFENMLISDQSSDSGENLAVEGRLANLLKNGRRDYDASATSSEPTHVSVLEMIMRDYSTETVTVSTEISLEELLDTGRARKSTEDGFDVYVLAETGEILRHALGGDAGNWPSIKTKIEVPKYPNGRRILRVGKDTILADEPWALSRWPWVIGRKYPLPHTWRGLNAVEMARKLQDWVNEAFSHLLNYVQNFGDPKVSYEEDAFPEGQNAADQISSRAGAIIKLAKGGLSKFRFESASQLPTGVVAVMDKMSQELRDQIGMQEVGIGRGGKDLTATEALRMETNTRMRTALQSLLMDNYTIDLMELVLDFARHWWTEGRQVRIVGDDDAKRVAKVNAEMLDAKFDLRLQVGTSLPYDTERRKQEATQLYNLLGSPLLERLLESYEIPERKTILQQFKVDQLVQTIAAQPGGLEMLQALAAELADPSDMQPAEPATNAANPQSMPNDSQSPLPDEQDKPQAPISPEMQNQGLPTQ